MIILFFISAFLVTEKLSISGAVGMLFVLFSPASMLLYERGNVDLFVFFVCAMAVFATSYSAYLATTLIVAASIMKLFPILGLSALLGEARKKFLWLSGISVSIVILYMVATWGSVKASWNLTMRGDGLSYGTDVFVDRYAAAIKIVLTRWLTPHRSDLLLQFAAALTHAEEFERARWALDAAFHTWPGDADLLLARGSLCETVFERRSRDWMGNEPWAARYESLTLERLAQLAVADFERAAGSAGSQPEARLRLGRMLMLRQKGWHSIAQDKATSVVYGMPRAAAEIGAAVEVLPIDRIAGAVQHALGTRASA